MPRKPSLDGKDSSLRIRMSPEQKEKLEGKKKRRTGLCKVAKVDRNGIPRVT